VLEDFLTAAVTVVKSRGAAGLTGEGKRQIAGMLREAREKHAARARAAAEAAAEAAAAERRAEQAARGEALQQARRWPPRGGVRAFRASVCRAWTRRCAGS
jgi:hypothetical protein